MCTERRFSQTMATEWQTAFVVSHKMPWCALLTAVKNDNKSLENCKTVSSRPRPRLRPRPNVQDQDQDFMIQDQVFHFCSRDASRPKPWSQGLQVGIRWEFKFNAYLICIATAMTSIATPTMVTQRIFNTHLFYLFFRFFLFTYFRFNYSFFLFTYLFTYFRFTYFRLNIYSFIYLFILILMAYGLLMAYGHTPLFPHVVGEFLSERQCQNRVDEQ